MQSMSSTQSSRARRLQRIFCFSPYKGEICSDNSNLHKLLAIDILFLDTLNHKYVRGDKL